MLWFQTLFIMDKIIFETYQKSEHRNSIYDQIDEEICKHFEILFNENSLDYELRDLETDRRVDFNLSSLLIHLNREKIKATRQTFKTYLESHFVKRYNPIQNYFKKLRWNGKDNIKRFSSYVHTDDNLLFYHHLKKWAVRAVKTVFDDNEINKHCLILANGEQNAGKSTYLEYLNPNILRPYYYTNIGVGKDDHIKLCKAFIINMEELDVLGRRDINSTKALISQKYVNVRLPYAEKATLMNRICSFVGSTNKLEFLNDETGSVRWIVFDVIGQLDWSYSKEFSIDDFWAEAYHIYLNEPSFYSDLTVDEVQENEKRNERYTIQTAESEYILRFYEQSEDVGDFRTPTDIVSELSVMGQKLNPMLLGRSLKKYGFVRVKHPKRQVYGYLARKKFGESPWGYYDI